MRTSRALRRSAFLFILLLSVAGGSTRNLTPYTPLATLAAQVTT